MYKSIKINNQEINYQLKTSHRAKNMRLCIYADGRFVISKPRRLSERLVEKFIIKKSSWILQRMEKIGPFKSLNSLKEDRAKYLKYKELARDLIKARADYFANFYNFSFNRMAIRDQKTCWGSCSKRKNLNFNYKILFLPEHLADYVIAHEICHLQELNHSARFWSLLSRSVPNYLEARKELKNLKN